METALTASDAVAAYRVAPFTVDADTRADEDAADVAVLLAPIVAGGLAPDLAAVEAFFAAGGAARARRWIVVSSSAICEPSHRHPGMVAEDAVSPPASNPVARAWAALEDLVGQALPSPLTVLRPAPATDGGHLFARLLRRGTAAAVAGFDPPVQLLRVDDLAAAVTRAVERPLAGVFHVAPASPVRLRRALRRAGVRRLPVPGPLHRLWRRPGETDYLRYPFTVSDDAIRRRLDLAPRSAGDGADDDHGMDRDYIAARGRRLLGFLHDRWWRVEWRGLEHLPRTGGAVLAGVHRGHQPWDGVMTLHLVFRELGRVIRFLTHPTLLKFPFLTPFMTGLGGVPAYQENADRVLAGGHLLGVYPEGIQGAFRLYRDAYQLGSFGRHLFVKLALRNRVPIIPFVTVGSAEVFPVLAKIRWRWWRRVSEWPCLPITPTMSLVPLPSKWHTLFLEPIHVEELHPAEAADDAVVVRELSREVRRRMQAAMTDLRRRRKSIWWGSIFDGETAGETP
jgi:1-acyl-sn-glycerol-3-phosphate acyltransferase